MGETSENGEKAGGTEVRVKEVDEKDEGKDRDVDMVFKSIFFLLSPLGVNIGPRAARSGLIFRSYVCSSTPLMATTLPLQRIGHSNSAISLTLLAAAL